LAKVPYIGLPSPDEILEQLPCDSYFNQMLDRLHEILDTNISDTSLIPYLEKGFVNLEPYDVHNPKNLTDEITLVQNSFLKRVLLKLWV
jgi:hypothetical protein